MFGFGFTREAGNDVSAEGGMREACDGGFVEDAAEESLEFDAGREVAAVGAEVDAAEDDFAEAGFAEALNFLKDSFGREAAAFSTNEGDDAIGAAGIAAVLNLQGGAGVVPFPAEDGRAEQNILFKNIAGQDICGRAQEGHGVRFQSGGWEKAI